MNNKILMIDENYNNILFFKAILKDKYELNIIDDINQSLSKTNYNDYNIIFVNAKFRFYKNFEIIKSIPKGENYKVIAIIDEALTKIPVNQELLYDDFITVPTSSNKLLNIIKRY